jgi:hypothetical protein
MIDRYTKIILTAVAVLFVLTIETPSASAVTCSAKTCSEAFQGCMTIGCHQVGGAGQNCFSNRNALRDRCMRTGEFLGSTCQLHGLIKK